MSHYCLDINGFLIVNFDGFGEVNKQTAGNNEHVPKAIVFTGLLTI